MMRWRELKAASDPEILAWASIQDWARAMANCQQEKEWHAEGDVWTHTTMVWREVLALPEWPTYSRSDQLILLWTALFHDIAKPRTTHLDPESGRLRSPKHALVGAHMARSILRDLGCDLQTREVICAMVRYHGRPVFVLERPNPERQVIELSWLLRHRLLFAFAVADTRGRLTADNRKEETLELWRMIAEELGCLDAPYAFANEHARFLFHREALGSLHYAPHEKFTCAVTMLSGLPGAGKDTWLARYAPELPVVSLDGIRTELDVDPTDNQGTVIQTAKERCREHLRDGRDFAFNATNLTPLTRQRWIDLFAEYRARIRIVYLEPPLKTILRQNQNRERQVPESVIHDLAEKAEPPQWGECHDLVWESPAEP